jgi:hypothetical protein
MGYVRKISIGMEIEKKLKRRKILNSIGDKTTALKMEISGESIRST